MPRISSVRLQLSLYFPGSQVPWKDSAVARVIVHGLVASGLWLGFSYAGSGRRLKKIAGPDDVELLLTTWPNGEAHLSRERVVTYYLSRCDLSLGHGFADVPALRRRASAATQPHARRPRSRGRSLGRDRVGSEGGRGPPRQRPGPRAGDQHGRRRGAAGDAAGEGGEVELHLVLLEHDLHELAVDEEQKDVTGDFDDEEGGPPAAEGEGVPAGR
jgi:hypothetical protein